MSIANPSSAMRTPAGCYVRHRFSSMRAIDGHCTPPGSSRAKGLSL